MALIISGIPTVAPQVGYLLVVGGGEEVKVVCVPVTHLVSVRVRFTSSTHIQHQFLGSLFQPKPQDVSYQKFLTNHSMSTS